MPSLALACRLGAVTAPRSIPRRVRSILSKYGATMLLPGVSGALRFGYQPGNYRESTGQTLAGTDQQVGLVVDAARVPGVELVANGGFDTDVGGWVNNGSGSFIWSSGSGRFTRSSFTDFASLAVPTIADRTYAVTFAATSVLGSNARVAAGPVNSITSGSNSLNNSVIGAGSIVFRATGTTSYVCLGADANGTVIDYDNISVRELPGIHASQSTSGFQPYLRQVPKTLGPELVVGAWGTATGVSVAGSGTDASIAFSNAGTGAASANLGAENVMQAGRKYRLTYTITNYSSGQFQFQSGGGGYASALRSANGTYSEEISPTAAATLVAKAQVSGSTFTVSNISIREVLEWTYAWQFDGTDNRLSLSAVPFQMADDHFVVAGATRGATGATRRLFHTGSGGDIQRVACLSFSSAGIPEVNYRDDSGSFVLVAGTAVWPQSPVVLSATSVSAALRLRADSALLATGTRPAGATTLTSAAVGAHTAGGAFFNGHIHGIIFGKGAISDSELLTLERFVASLQGRSL